MNTITHTLITPEAAALHLTIANLAFGFWLATYSIRMLVQDHRRRGDKFPS